MDIKSSGRGRLETWGVALSFVPFVRGEEGSEKALFCVPFFKQNTDAGCCRWKTCSRFLLPKQLWVAFACRFQGRSCIPGNCSQVRGGM